MTEKHTMFYFQFVLFGIITLSSDTQSFKITNCSSNMINEQNFDPVKKKAFIRYDESNPIQVTSGTTAKKNVELSCESDTIFQKCSLIHHRRNQIQCEYSSPPLCHSEDSCMNNKINYVSTSPRTCKFVLEEISEHGK